MQCFSPRWNNTASSFGFLRYTRVGFEHLCSNLSGDYRQTECPLSVSLFPLPQVGFSIHITTSLCNVIVWHNGALSGNRKVFPLQEQQTTERKKNKRRNSTNTRIGPNRIGLKNFRIQDFSELETEATESVQHCRLSRAVVCTCSESWQYASHLLLEHLVTLQWNSRHRTMSGIVKTTHYFLLHVYIRVLKIQLGAFTPFLTNDLFGFLGTIGHVVFLLWSFHFDVSSLTAKGNVDQKRSFAVVQLRCKQQVQQLLQESRSLSCSFSGMKEGDVATYVSGKSET